jgi:hypothetical protein
MRSSRLKNINEIIKKSTNINRSNDEIVEKIMKKFFDILEEYSFKPAEKIMVGDIIKYVDLNLEKVSIYGIVMKINYNETIMDKSLKSFDLFNNITQTYWKVNPKKVYIFKSYKLGEHSKRRTLKANLFLMEEIENYKKSFDQNNIEN